jgi:hypothetical protein
VADLVSSDRAHSFGQIHDLATWGKVTFNRLSEDVVFITHDRCQPLENDDLLETAYMSDAAKQFLIVLNCMLEESRQLENFLALLMEDVPDKNVRSKRVDLFVSGYEGRC